ncbi:glycosyltransferase [Actinokineospora pegani]|uniref:glycosyltransferase n=1 Tax=Actinokineospora pegani TaxID=2654637 RepID=UPI0012EAEFF8|nr:glycosyltransferase [Actinokineospora pegani]
MGNRVVYLAPDHNEPSGGIRAIYRHVELLTAAGHDAVVWHLAEGFACDWFDTTAPVVNGPHLLLDGSDTLVVPEVLVIAGNDPAPGCRKVVYNQNHFYTFDNTSAEGYPGWPGGASTWVSSTTSVEVLRRVHGSDVALVPYSLDFELFAPAARRVPKVVWMPRKRPREAAVLEAMFRADERFAGVELVSVDGLTEAGTAAHLGDASVFVALGHQEGFGLPVAEALAAGCAVVGYAAGGGAELFEVPGTVEVADADLVGLVEAVAAVLAQAPTDEQRAAWRGAVAARYTAERQLDALVSAIEAARATPGAAGTATYPDAAVLLGDDGPSFEEQLRGRIAELEAALDRTRDEQDAQRVARERAEEHATAAREHAEGLEKQLESVLAEHAEVRRRVNLLTEQLADLRHERADLRRAADRVVHLEEVSALLEQYRKDNDRLNHRLTHELAQLSAVMHRQLDEVRGSTSWKVTAPLRRVSDAISSAKGGRHG